MQHRFGIITFIELSQVQIEKGSATDTGWIHPPEKFDREDPFCYYCGMKFINVHADTECQGRSRHSLNVDLTALPHA